MFVLQVWCALEMILQCEPVLTVGDGRKGELTEQQVI